MAHLLLGRSPGVSHGVDSALWELGMKQKVLLGRSLPGDVCAHLDSAQGGSSEDPWATCVGNVYSKVVLSIFCSHSCRISLSSSCHNSSKTLWMPCKRAVTGVYMVDLGGISDSCHVNLLQFPITCTP